MSVKHLIDKLNNDKKLLHGEWLEILEQHNDEDREYAAGIARDISIKQFGKNVFIRGIVEFSNVCRNDCYYCGIRCSNKNIKRYRLSKEQILSCCENGYQLGFRTFVLQSGEDPYYTVDILADIIKTIKANYNDCALTLSIGEKSRAEYQTLYDAGADRFLLRHETADEEHYGKLHPSSLSWKNRIECLHNLKDIGFQTGCGMMVGSPYQTVECLAKDMEFICEFKPQMIGIGPFIPHSQTPFAEYPSGSFELTVYLLSLCRIMLPGVLLPATTALGTIKSNGRELGILSGANVIMPNLSPTDVRKNYFLYNNKISADEKPEQSRKKIDERVASIGYNTVIGRGDYGENYD